MANASDIVFGIAIEAIDKASGTFSKVGESVKGLGGLFDHFKGKITPVVDVVNIAEKAFHFLIHALKEAPKAASEYEDAVTKLSSALKTQGTYTKETSDHLIEFASNMQETTKYSDEQVMSAQTLLISLGKLKGEGLDQATKATADLAAGLGIGMEEAAKMMSRVINGGATQIRGLSMEFHGAAGSADKLNSVLKGVEGAFGGRAVTDAATFSGSITKMKHAFDDLLKVVGAQNINFLQPIIDSLTTGLQFAAKNMNPFIEKIEDTFVDIRAFVEKTAAILIHWINSPFDPNTYAEAVKVFLNFFGNVFNLLKQVITKGVGWVADQLGQILKDEVTKGKSIADQIIAIDSKAADDKKKIHTDLTKGLQTLDKSVVQSAQNTADQTVDITKKASQKALKDLEATLKARSIMNDLTIDQEIAAYQSLIDNKKVIDDDADTVHNKLLELRAKKEKQVTDYVSSLWETVKDDQIHSWEDLAASSKKILKKMFHDYIQGVEQKIIADTASGVMAALSAKNFVGAGIIGATGASELVIAQGADSYVQGLETGGIVTSDGLYRVGEKNRQEAVIPLESGAGKQALAQALGQSGNDNSFSGSINNHIYIDGRKFAEVLTNAQSMNRLQGRA